jgi:hypothetical protein
MSSTSSTAPHGGHRALTRRMSYLCHAIRWSALLWAVSATAMISMIFASPDRVAEYYGRFFKVDLSNLPTSGYALALLIVVLDASLVWLVVVFIWRLFGHYVRTDIFSHAAVNEMWRCGWTGVAAVVVDITARPALAYALTQHLSGNQHHYFWTFPDDLLHLMLALFVVALAFIFRTGVEIADDNRQIV